MVPEARLERLETGLAPVSDGWFVVNVPEAAWVTNPERGDACIFESDVVSFPQVGFTLVVMQPGQVPGMYHREANQENFLVLSGECVLVIEGVERRLRAWDFVHCPPDCEHAFIGAGDGPCMIFMTGAREGWPDEKGLFYPVSEAAARYGASAKVDTRVPREAYARFPPFEPGPPASWAGTPWA